MSDEKQELIRVLALGGSEPTQKVVMEFAAREIKRYKRENSEQFEYLKKLEKKLDRLAPQWRTEQNPPE